MFDCLSTAFLDANIDAASFELIMKGINFDLPIRFRSELLNLFVVFWRELLLFDNFIASYEGLFLTFKFLQNVTLSSTYLAHYIEFFQVHQLFCPEIFPDFARVTTEMVIAGYPLVSELGSVVAAFCEDAARFDKLAINLIATVS
jgi:hypothetical protein